MSQEPAAISSSAHEGHLRVDQLSGDLKHRSARGSATMIVSYAIQLLIGVSGTAVLARLLKPSDFGYLAMVGTLLNFVLTLREFLLTPAVQNEQLTHVQASGLFWINCIASITIGILVASTAPFMAWFFREPRLIGITVAMGVGVLFAMIGMLHMGLLRRQMQFRSISIIEIGAMLGGAVAGVVSAKLGAGYWALVIQQLTIWLWQSVAAWWLCSWRPASHSASAFLKDAGVRSMFHFGKNTTFARILSYIGRNTDSVLVGYFSGPGTLGLYQKAYQWAMLPFWQMYLPMTPVAVSSFSRLQDDPERYRSYARTTLMGLFSLSLPATALLAIEADSVIPVLFGNQWIDAIPILQILCIGGYFSVFTQILNWIYLPEGRSTDLLCWQLFAAPITMTGVAIGVHWDVIGVSIGFTAAAMLLIVPGIWYCLRRSPLSVADFLGAAWRAILASLIAALLLFLLRWEFHFASVPVILRFIIHCAMYGTLYLALWILLPGGRAHFNAILHHFRSLRPAVAAETI